MQRVTGQKPASSFPSQISCFSSSCHPKSTAVRSSPMEPPLHPPSVLPAPPPAPHKGQAGRGVGVGARGGDGQILTPNAEKREMSPSRSRYRCRYQSRVNPCGAAQPQPLFTPPPALLGAIRGQFGAKQPPARHPPPRPPPYLLPRAAAAPPGIRRRCRCRCRASPLREAAGGGGRRG